MIDNLKKILNEDQDPKAIEKITSKLNNLLMSNEEIGYIAVQKKPAVTILPDSIVVTNKRIILCKPKNLGLSMVFIDNDWTDITASFVKEGILGADFTYTTKSDITHTIDYLPKNQARKLYTYTKEQLEIVKNGSTSTVQPLVSEAIIEIEETETEEVTNFAEIVTSTSSELEIVSQNETFSENNINQLTKEQLFEKLQNYKKLLDNGLILQGDYDKLKNEIIGLL